MKLTRMLMVGVVMAAGVIGIRAQDASADKALIANERAINEAIAKGNLAGFKQYVAADAWTIDPAAGRAPVVHEVAHQWWGNAVTERDWDDVWLSEGFATYFTHLFTEQFSGREAFVRGLRNDVNTILQAQLKLPAQAVIHRNIDDMRGVLNRFVYQKGGWVLHMLRGTIGTDAFWEGIREYYRRHRD